jgi:hypothetical protein
MLSWKTSTSHENLQKALHCTKHRSGQCTKRKEDEINGRPALKRLRQRGLKRRMLRSPHSGGLWSCQALGGAFCKCTYVLRGCTAPLVASRGRSSAASRPNFILPLRLGFPNCLGRALGPHLAASSGARPSTTALPGHSTPSATPWGSHSRAACGSQPCSTCSTRSRGSRARRGGTASE